MQHKFK